MTWILLFGIATIALGAAFLWLGTIFQMSSNPAIANDSRVWLGIGMGMVLAGCGFSFVTGLLYPNMAFEARRQAAMAQMPLASTTNVVAATCTGKC
jgi:hypothetical protein